MKLRTPRRRISPQVPLRYRAIRGFLRRALGTQSQNTIQVDSSVSGNFEGLQNKILRLEDHLKAESYYPELIESRERTRRSVNQNANENILTLTDRSDHGRRPLDGTETELINQTTENQFQKSYYRDDSLNSVDETSLIAPGIPHLETQCCRPKKMKREMIEKISRRFGSEYNRFHSYFHTNINRKTDDCAPSVTSHHKYLTPRTTNRRAIKKKQNPEAGTYQRKPEYNKSNEQLKRHKSNSPRRCHQFTPGQNRTAKSNVNQEFIADIIRRQYKPVKRFMTKESAISQLTVPEYLDGASTYCTFEELNQIPENRRCHDRQQHGNYTGNGDYYDVRNISDLDSMYHTRQYSNRQRYHTKQQRQTEIYNDSTLYDVIPVKERSSPKIRRRHTEYDLTEDYQPYDNHYRRSLSFSPKSHRPRPNLRSQFYQECEHNSPREKPNRKSSSKKQRRKPNSNVVKALSSSSSRDTQYCENAIKRPLNGCGSILGEDRIPKIPPNTDYDKQVYSNEFRDQNNKTVNTLLEIKDLLKNFLDELKKDVNVLLTDKSTSNGIHPQTLNKTEHTNINTNTNINTIGTEENNTAIETNIDYSKEHPMDLSYATNMNPHIFNNEQCLEPSPYMLSKTNNFCYPIHPTSQLNFAACACNPGLQTNAQYQKSDGANYRSNEGTTENDVLLKEIHKLVSQDRKIKRKESACELKKTKTAEVVLTARSVCESHVSKRDAQVGTPRLQCCFRSSEAIGSPVMNNLQKANYSDTDFERVIELTDLESDAKKPLQPNVEYKSIRAKFSKVLQSFFKKKKNKCKYIEEMDESELFEDSISSRDMRHISRRGSLPAHYQPYPPYLSYQARSPPPAHYNYRDPNNHHITKHTSPMHYLQHNDYKHPWSHPHPSAPPYHPEHYPYPNVWLQEIEITSTATQSEKKLSFFKKLTKIKPQAKSKDDYYQSSSTQSTQHQKPGPSNLKKNPKRPSEVFLSHAEHKKMVLGNTKLRNAVLKKMLQKKNPFSSRNLLLKTLIGKIPS